jgi:hypothetical protein
MGEEVLAGSSYSTNVLLLFHLIREHRMTS